MMASLRISAVVRPLQEETMEQTRPLLRTLFLAVAVVLLIACVNLAGMMLVRAIRRQREVAVRLALGREPSALLRQAMLESLVLECERRRAGLLMAAVALRVGKSLLPESLPRINEIALNWEVVGFALLLAVLTGLLCGLAPAFAALRTNVNANLKEGGRSGTAGGGHARLRSALVVAEIAIALVLLAASGLLLRSFEKMRAVDLGFRPEHVATASYSLPQKQYSKQAQVDDIQPRVAAATEADAGRDGDAALTERASGGRQQQQPDLRGGWIYAAQGRGHEPGDVVPCDGRLFPGHGNSAAAGRMFTDADRHGSQLVMIVNQKTGAALLAGPGPDRQTDAHRHTGDADSVDDGGGRSGGREAGLAGRPNEGAVLHPVAQAEDDFGRSHQPTDLNGNGGYHRGAVGAAAGADGECAARDGARDRSATAADAGADHGAGGFGERGSAALQHGADQRLRLCGGIAGGAGDLQRDCVLGGLARAGDGDPHGAGFAARGDYSAGDASRAQSWPWWVA